jgi:uncharacterized membrane protein
MNEPEISSAAELDSVLRGRALRREAELRKVAAGHSFRWTEVLGFALALLLVLAGLVQYFDNGEGAIQVALGFALVASFLWSHMQRQLTALAELVKRLEGERGTRQRTDD